MNTPQRTQPGDRGDAVRAWQTFLAERGLLVGAVDGVHGRGTEAASLAYERQQAAAAASTGALELTDEQRHAIDCVLSIFETGRVPSAASYATCTVLPDGAGISYGKHQATDRAGSLDLVCQRYVDRGGALAAELQPYLSRLAVDDSTKVDLKGVKPEWLAALMGLLKRAGADPVMQQAQDEVFAEQYLRPALEQAAKLGLTTALGALVLYDTCIHSGPGRVAKHAAQVSEPAPRDGGSEETWLAQYVAVRRAWLAASTNPLVRQCVYRPDELQKLIAAGNWELQMPFKCRGQEVA